jgi:hypothetical protein
MATVQAPDPLHAPLQPLKTLPETAVGVSVTEVPLAIDAAQVLPHSIPPTLLLTDPEPVSWTVKV